MALLNIALVLVLACAPALGESIFQKGGRNDTVVYTSNTTTLAHLDGALVYMSKLDIQVKNEANPGPPPPPPHSAADAAQIFELVNEHVASIQAMPQNANVQAPQLYADLPLVREVTGDISIESGKPQPQGKLIIKIRKVEYANKPNATLTTQH